MIKTKYSSHVAHQEKRLLLVSTIVLLIQQLSQQEALQWQRGCATRFLV